MRFKENPEIIGNYALLDQMGVFQEIDSLEHEINDLNGLLDWAGKLFSLTELKDVANSVADYLVQKFIPSFLVFAFQPDGSTAPEIIAYRNLKEADLPFDLPNLTIFEELFVTDYEIRHFQERTVSEQNPIDLDFLNPINPELIVPVQGPGGLYGIVIIAEKVIGNSYTTSEINSIKRLMNIAAIAFKNSIHYYSSVTDGKTGLFNNAYFQSHLEEEVSRANRYHTYFGLLLLDLDHFKVLNDTYGHLAGDAVLVEVSDILRSSIRDGDVPARFGGEEFVVYLHDVNIESAMGSAERLRKEIEKAEFIVDDARIKTTVSIGCVIYSPVQPRTRNQLFQAADEALYTSKKSGRNRTTLAKN